MAEASISEDHFMCSVCLDLLKDPVTVPCGHTYCMRCITDCWNQEDQTRIYSCPQCRQTFSPRPVLGKNVMIAKILEKLKKTKVKCAVSDQCSSGAGDVECDVCTGRKHKAIKSCLLCLNSYCQTHLEQHENLFRGQRHNLIDATAPLHDMICPQHDKILEIYCRTDQKLICMLCMMAEHKNHETVLAAEEETHKERHLKETKRNFQQRIQKRELEKTSERVKHTEIIHSPELKTRDQFLQYSLQLTLDLNTVNKLLHLSEDNTEITNNNTQRQYPDHPDRFDVVFQVLCRESVCGRSYWEIEWSGRVVDISVSYKSIMRKGRGDECVFGRNDQSWSLICRGSSYSFSHNNKHTNLSVKIRSNRIGVYVDERAGILSFYSVSDTMTLIHSISTTFTQPLYPGFFVCYKSSVKLCVQ
ncbi:E3 ubiquitin/ISG15 ligase TRIM25-like [Triplophysa dalaica]|uniref:E3 ubiquitin/ISG15 ligase TRIM25-like n=1 Tax=Triplophysa dalaica TaxID=1582913 RepID=UPI0024DF6520|nr:E3 ubiquitin/ISG15 ligase TRIM25-like [Triplophysa dalaica]